MKFLFLMILLLSFFHVISGRARLIEPPMRSSIWRYHVYNVPENLLDEHLNCGGFEYQWTVANGNCGTCGDPFYGPANNVYPGLFANNVLTRTVTQGTFLNVTVFAEKNLLGYFKFNLCPDMNGKEYVDLDSCFQKNPLKIFDTNSTTYFVGSGGGTFNMMLVLPPDVVCDHCVLQWIYVTGYREGRDLHSCRDCLGCGPQETYINCADFTIEPFIETRLHFDTRPQNMQASFNQAEQSTATQTTPVAVISTENPTASGSSTTVSTTDEPTPRGSVLVINGTLTGDSINGSDQNNNSSNNSNSLVINLSTLIENGANLAQPNQNNPVNTTSQPPGTSTNFSDVYETTTFGTPTPSSTSALATPSSTSSPSTSPLPTRTLNTLTGLDGLPTKQFYPLSNTGDSKNSNASISPANPFRGTMMNDTTLSDKNQSEIHTQVHNQTIKNSNIEPNQSNSHVVTFNRTISAVRINIKEEFCFSNSTYLRCESKTRTVSWCLEQCYKDACPKTLCSCYCLMVNGEKYPLSTKPINVLQRLPSFSHKSSPKRLCYLPRKRFRFATALSVWCETNCPGIRCYSLCLPQPC